MSSEYSTGAQQQDCLSLMPTYRSCIPSHFPGMVECARHCPGAPCHVERLWVASFRATRAIGPVRASSSAKHRTVASRAISSERGSVPARVGANPLVHLYASHQSPPIRPITSLASLTSLDRIPQLTTRAEHSVRSLAPTLVAHAFAGMGFGPRETTSNMELGANYVRSRGSIAVHSRGASSLGCFA